jgi:type I restriction enzyme S subunit
LIASTGFAVLSPRAGDWAYLHAAITRREVGEELGQLADGGAYPAVRPEAVGKLSLIVPKSPDILIKLQEIVGPLFERAAKNRMDSRTLAALHDTLLPKLISGELRLKDAERFVSEVAS